MKKRGSMAVLLYGATDFGAPHFSADILWRTGFRVPDPLFLLEHRGKATLFASVLEYGRAKKESRADAVVLLNAGWLESISSYCKKKKIRRVQVSSDFPYALAEKLRNHVAISIHHDPVYLARFIKTKAEIAEIARAAQATDAAIADARLFLKSCTVDKGFVIAPARQSVGDGGRHQPKQSRSSKGAIRNAGMTRHTSVVTSELLRARIESFLFNRGYLALGTIVACGAQAADPHCAGLGAIKPHEPIVIDVFPLSRESHYYADCTRTLFKGEPTPAMKKMYKAVLGAQEGALAMVRAGVDASNINAAVVERFETAGYSTRVNSSPPYFRKGGARGGKEIYGFTPTPNLVWGFIHSLGHGVGLEIHEPPRISKQSEILQKGNVVTVEPGLYYPKLRHLKSDVRYPIGGIRIEDLVVVEKTGCRRLSKLPKSLDWALIP